MDEGHYMLVTGTRMANGSVLAEMSFFNVEPGKTSDIKLEMRESQDDVQESSATSTPKQIQTG